MLGQVITLLNPEGRRALAAEFGAWWEGEPSPRMRRAVPPPRAPLAPIAASAQRPPTPTQVRMEALSLAWGPDRCQPGSDEIDDRLLEAVLATIATAGPMAFMGGDPAILNACRARTERPVFAGEWRAGRLDWARKLSPGVILTPAALERDLPFPARKLEALITLDVLAAVENKPDLARRCFESLTGTGRWAVLDLTRPTNAAPPEGFTPDACGLHLATTEETGALLRAAGFVAVRRENLNSAMVRCIRGAILRMGRSLSESDAEAALQSTRGPAMLDEIANDLKNWRARLQALEARTLSADLWLADRDPSRRETAPKPAEGLVWN